MMPQLLLGAYCDRSEEVVQMLVVCFHIWEQIRGHPEKTSHQLLNTRMMLALCRHEAKTLSANDVLAVLHWAEAWAACTSFSEAVHLSSGETALEERVGALLAMADQKTPLRGRAQLNLV